MYFMLDGTEVVVPQRYLVGSSSWWSPKKINFDNDQAYNSGATIGKEVDTHQPVTLGALLG